MKQEINLEFENEEIICSIDDHIIIMKIKTNAFYGLTNIDRSRELMQWFQLVADNPELKGILVLNEKGSLGNTSHEVYVSSIKKKKSDKKESPYDWESSRIRSIEINMINNYINTVLHFPKLVISGLRGSVVSAFLGASLAADFRLASSDTVFYMSHVNYDLHAGGALPFLLPKYIGQGRAAKYLIEGGEISAQQALEMGIVTEVLPDENFESLCRERTKEISNRGADFIMRTKELLLDFRKDFIEYSNREGKFIEHY